MTADITPPYGTSSLTHSLTHLRTDICGQIETLSAVAAAAVVVVAVAAAGFRPMGRRKSAIKIRVMCRGDRSAQSTARARALSLAGYWRRRARKKHVLASVCERARETIYDGHKA